MKTLITQIWVVCHLLPFANVGTVLSNVQLCLMCHKTSNNGLLHKKKSVLVSLFRYVMITPRKAVP